MANEERETRPAGTPKTAAKPAASAATDYAFGLHHVQLALPPGGEELCRSFYVDVLGMTELEKPPVLAARGGLWVRADSLEIHLGVEEDFRPARKAHPGILVADLDGLAQRLTGKGVEITWDDDFPGHRRFYASDCHGNRLEFLSPQRD
ncbi:VOC family protein [Streptomyces sp. NPDC051907]|uniref:VOC family protein n=1 Tax=Streptomyces sp. NPDC051907 TaxID=3155284 RepID=UPI00341CAE02